MLRRFLVILAAFSSFAAWAECTQYQVSWRSEPGPWSSSKAAACSAINGKSYSASSGGISTTITVSGAHIDQYENCAYQEKTVLNGGEPSVQNTSSGFDTRVVASCESSCTALMGEDFTLNWSIGYTRTPNIDEDPNWKLVAPPIKPPSDGLVCDPVTSCKVALVLNPIATWQSLSPTAQGLYRLSVDFDAQHMGESCTPTPAENAAAHPAADKPTCPGFVGEVNGVPGCYGTASNPTSNDVPETKPKPPEAGNPPAGKKPDSGEGSGTGGAGRTPSTGDGGPGGGPAGAAGSGTKPDGTTPKPGEGKEQANCGAPGQPKCSINEAGTPDGKGAFDSANSGLDEGKKGWIAEIEKVKDLTAPGWTWTFQLPSGCTPLDVPAFNLTLDVCRFQPIIHDIMSMLWAIATVMGCALMVFNATGKN